jgi:hypothetical protein
VTSDQLVHRDGAPSVTIADASRSRCTDIIDPEDPEAVLPE